MIRLNLKAQPGRNHLAAIALLEGALEIFRADAERSRAKYMHRKNGCRWVKLDGRYSHECRCPPEARR